MFMFAQHLCKYSRKPQLFENFLSHDSHNVTKNYMSKAGGNGKTK